MASRVQPKRPRLRRSLTAPARAVMQAFRLAKFSASPFMSSCGIFPEVSESASYRLHAIVNEVATRRLKKGKYLRDLRKRLHQLGTARNGRKRAPADIVDLIDTDVTALLACEATAAYLFGLSVGLNVRSLPERLNRSSLP